MKRYLLIKAAFVFLTFALISCSSDDDGGCRCEGEFVRFTDDGSVVRFTAFDVDCDTGQPALDNNPGASFQGCKD